MIELAVAQTALGHEVRIVSPEQTSSSWIHRGVTIDGVVARMPRPWRDYEFLWAARRRLRAHAPDVLHFHSVQEGARLTSFLDVPTVLSVDYFRYRASERSAVHRYYAASLARFDRIIPISEACATEFQRFWGNPAPLAVIPTGVNTEQFRPDRAAVRRGRARLGIEGPLVLYVGRLCEQKGTDVLLDAWERHRPPGTLVLAGPFGQFGNTQPSALSDRIAALGGRHLGSVEEAYLADLYNACDVFVMPTTRDEMFGMAALEAQACGKPVVASKLGGLVESVSSDGGLFVPPGDADALGVSLSELIGNPHLQKVMGEAGRKHAVSLSWAASALRYQSVYDSILR
jgi:glycosyltransferase involved in cell wall biosynthesis